MSILSEIYKYNRFAHEDVPVFEGKLFYEGDRRRPYLVRFVMLLFLSTVIASYGVVNDSAATVIGAMIIAPLMTPIMATAAAMVMGNMPRVPGHWHWWLPASLWSSSCLGSLARSTLWLSLPPRIPISPAAFRRGRRTW